MTTMQFSKKDNITLVLMLFALVIISFMHFQDTSEPRYAEIARLMYSSGDWITPWFEPGKPFWGKPPLSFWAAAASMHVFGVNEFAARFPSWLGMVLSLCAIRYVFARVYGQSTAQWAALIYASMILVFINIGAVLTDPFLALGTTLVFCSFIMRMWQEPSALSTSEYVSSAPQKSGAALSAESASGFATESGDKSAFNSGPSKMAFADSRVAPKVGSKFWAYLGFIGLAIGLLAKGPLTLVLVGAPIAVYLAWHKDRWSRFLHAYPWLQGLLLVAVLVLPWYILAEMKTPGFLHYFIVGEHFLRFVDPGRQGDLYGTAHQQAYGTIWLNALVASLPWWPVVVLVLVWLWRRGDWARVRAAFRGFPMFSFVFSWALFCGAFFTFSGNILWTYLLPSMVAISLIFARVLQLMPSLKWQEKVPYLALLAPSLLVLIVAIGALYPNIWRSEKYLVAYTQTQEQSELYYYKELPFSARFYSEERVQSVDEADLANLPERTDENWYIAVSKKAIDEFNQYKPEGLALVYENKRYYLFKHSPTI